jgi:predicted alpha/beta superfamily hydrolase
LTEVKTLHSSKADRDYTISVALPGSYSSETSKTYPVVYLLDADLFFGAVTEPTRLLQWGEELPELIIVGIGYGISWDDPDEFMRLRSNDLRPTNVDTNPGSGGAAEFLKFIQEDLFPYINENFRTDPVDRTIAGISDGGLFSLYVLFHSPATFNRYVVASPHLGWDDRVIFEYEEGFAKKNPDLPAKLFLAVGDLDREFASDLKDFHKRLEDRNYAGLEMHMVVMEEETHLSVFPGAFSRGLRTVFR